VVAGDDVTESKLDYMRKKGLRNISEQQLFLLVRYWANDKMYEDMMTPAAKSTPKKSQASPQKKKPVEKDTEKPATKKRGPTKEERAADILSLFE
jgi:ribosomal protein L12E/L44/L45/RPP1/RPP2